MKITRLVFLFILALIAAVFSISAEEPDSSYDDGPHVFWADSNVAIVFCLHEDSIAKHTYRVEDTLWFSAHCQGGLREFAVPRTPPIVHPDQCDSVSSIFALSDIHGEFESFVEILIAASVIDADLNWTFGDGHLVTNGDIFDRGDRVTECLWLVYFLERQAIASGGMVHFILGNHEVMVLQDDLRYVNDKYLKGIARKSRIHYDELFGPDMELGRWLRTKHAVIKLNNLLFVHGGVSNELIDETGIGITGINDVMRRHIDAPSYVLAFDSTVQKYFKGMGPLWYRGLMLGIEDRYQEATGEQVDQLLTHFGVDKIIVGHSEGEHIRKRHGGKVIGLDVDREALGGFEGLLITPHQMEIVDRHGRHVELK
jgi:hypothetical protein